MKDENTFWARLKKVQWEAIIVEDGKLSLGRIIQIVMTVAAFIFWFNAVAIPTSFLTIYLAIMGYNFGKKPVEAYKHWASSDKVDKKPQEGE